MARKKTRTVNLYITPTSFSSLFKRFSGKKVEEFDFSDLAELRQLLSNERAKILYVIKTKNPDSIYHLSKLVKREFKSVLKDVRILEKFGFLSLVNEKKGNRRKLKPKVEIDELKIIVGF